MYSLERIAFESKMLKSVYKIPPTGHLIVLTTALTGGTLNKFTAHKECLFPHTIVKYRSQPKAMQAVKKTNIYNLSVILKSANLIMLQNLE